MRRRPLARDDGSTPAPCSRPRDRGRFFARFAIALAVAGLSGCDRLIERQIERNLDRVDTETLSSPDLQVVLCGTGSPLPDAGRAAACSAVIANGELWLVDVGPGAWETVDLADLPAAALRGVLLTHFHSDHVGDLGEAITQSWIAGRAEPLEVVGPEGVARIVDGLARVYAADVDARVAHHGDEWLPRSAAGAIAREFPLPAEGEGLVVLERGGLRITAFAVDHRPVTPAVGYRFDWRGRSVVFSGDTRASANLAQFARGADLLIHEGLDAEMIRRVVEVAARTGRRRMSKLAGDVIGYHTTPVEAARIAHDAGVATLVFHHIVPPPNQVLARWRFLRGVADVFAGEVVLGDDGRRFALAPKP